MEAGVCLPGHSEVACRVVDLDHRLVLRRLPVPSVAAATAGKPTAPHHRAKPIDHQQAVKDCQREADAPAVGLELGVGATHEADMALRELEGADCVYIKVRTRS